MKLIFISSDGIGDAILTGKILEIVANNLHCEVYLYIKRSMNSVALFQNTNYIKTIKTFNTNFFSLSFFRDTIALFKQIHKSLKEDDVYISATLGSTTFVKILPLMTLWAKLFSKHKLIIIAIKPCLDISKEHIIAYHIKKFEETLDVKFQTDDSSRENFLENFIGGKYAKEPKTITILAGASNLKKTLPAQKFAKIIKHFACNGYKIKLLGSKSDVDQFQANEIMRLISGSVHIENLAGKTNLKEYFTEIAKAEYVITNDSSGQHIANVLHTPCAVFWARKKENPVVKAYAWQNKMTVNIFSQNYEDCNECSILKKLFLKKSHCHKCMKQNYDAMDASYLIKEIESHIKG